MILVKLSTTSPEVWSLSALVQWWIGHFFTFAECHPMSLWRVPWILAWTKIPRAHSGQHLQPWYFPTVQIPWNPSHSRSTQIGNKFGAKVVNPGGHLSHGQPLNFPVVHLPFSEVGVLNKPWQSNCSLVCVVALVSGESILESWQKMLETRQILGRFFNR